MSDPSLPASTPVPPSPRAPSSARPSGRPPTVQYKGGELDAARGPGLGCFYVQLAILAALLIVTPLSAKAGWPPAVSAILLVGILVLLLLTGQTAVFLMRLVAADRGRRRPLASPTPTVGDIESSESSAPAGTSSAADLAAQDAPSSKRGERTPEHGDSMRE